MRILIMRRYRNLFRRSFVARCLVYRMHKLQSCICICRNGWCAIFHRCGIGINQRMMGDTGMNLRPSLLEWMMVLRKRFFPV